jgi:hypothetical protein
MVHGYLLPEEIEGTFVLPFPVAELSLNFSLMFWGVGKKQPYQDVHLEPKRTYVRVLRTCCCAVTDLSFQPEDGGAPYLVCPGWMLTTESPFSMDVKPILIFLTKIHTRYNYNCIKKLEGTAGQCTHAMHSLTSGQTWFGTYNAERQQTARRSRSAFPGRGLKRISQGGFGAWILLRASGK